MASGNEWDDYFYYLGAFMHEFSRMENDVNAILSEYIAEQLSVGAKDTRQKDILKAATGGMRFANLRDTLKRVMRAAGANQDQMDGVSDVLSHLGDIQHVRDKLAHNGATLATNSDANTVVETDNVFTANERDKREVVQFPISVLSDLAHDSDIGPVCLYAKLAPSGAEAIKDAMAQPHYEPFLRGEPPAWRYKPSSLTRRRPSKATTLRKSPSLPPSSADAD